MPRSGERSAVARVVGESGVTNSIVARTLSARFVPIAAQTSQWVKTLTWGNRPSARRIDPFAPDDFCAPVFSMSKGAKLPKPLGIDGYAHGPFFLGTLLHSWVGGVCSLITAAAFGAAIYFSREFLSVTQKVIVVCNWSIELTAIASIQVTHVTIANPPFWSSASDIRRRAHEAEEPGGNWPWPAARIAPRPRFPSVWAF